MSRSGTLDARPKQDVFRRISSPVKPQDYTIDSPFACVLFKERLTPGFMLDCKDNQSFMEMYKAALIISATTIGDMT
jgi:hypothetical protein